MMTIWRSTIAGFVLATLAGVAYAQSTGDDALSARVDEVVRTQMREQKIPGVSLGVMRDGKIIKAKGYGLANVELNVPVTPESVFHTESVGKTFTAVGVLILAEEGKLGLDDKITKYIPEAPAAWRDVTVRQLLTHTSGIPDYVGEFDGKGLVDLQKNYTEDEVIQIVARQPLDFQPGERRVYSNSGYVMLGALIRHVTGKNWADFLQERIFGPLGMTSTRVISEADIIPNRTSGYHLVNAQWKNTDWVAPSLNTLADGTLYTSVLDMAKWDEGLSTEKILKRTTIDQIWIPIKLNSGKIFPQGLCFRIDDVNGHRLAWKDGEFQGYTTIMARYLDDHLTIVVLTNLGEDATIPVHISERVAAIYIPALAKGNGQKPPAAPAQETDQSIESNSRTALRLSSQQEDVWKGEQDYFRYLQAKNLPGFMSLWDDNFLGWPDYSELPLRKRDIESGVAAEFQSLHQSARPVPAPKPEAIGVFGGVAVTHYFWPEAEDTATVKYRITHTWRKGRDGWRIISGMDCAVSSSAEATPSATGSSQSSKSKVATSTVPPEPDLPSKPAPHSVEAQVLELDRAWGQAYVKGDIDVIDRTLAPDWRGWLDTEGSDKATELAEFKAGKNRSLENIIDNTRVRVYGNTAVVEARERVRFRDETGEHWLTWHITDVFVRQGGQWRVVASHGSTIPNP